MRDRLIELLKQKSCVYVPCDNECGGCKNVEMYDDSIESIADHLLAEGVIVLLCKVGDTVYQTDGIRIYELEIFDVSLKKYKPYYETESVDFDDTAIGKSIFLTKEEAENALTERSENGK